MSNSSWCDLPNDILLEIIKSLSFKDLIPLGRVCKSWRPIVRQETTGRPAYMMPRLIAHEIRHRLHPWEVRRLHSANVCASNFGWLLLSDNDSVSKKAVMFFYNPLQNIIIELPPLPSDDRNSEAEDLATSICVSTATFTHPPADPNCEIFLVTEKGAPVYGIWVCKIYRFTLKEKRWSSIQTIDGCPGTILDLTYIDRTLYWRVELFDGNPCWKTKCQVYKAETGQQDFNIACLENPWCDEYDGAFYYLVRTKCGSLYLAIRYHKKLLNSTKLAGIEQSYWKVYKLDRSSGSGTKWISIIDLGNRVLFLNEHEYVGRRRHSSPMVVTAIEGRMANKILLVGSERCWSFTCGNTWSYERSYPLDNHKGCSYTWIEPQRGPSMIRQDGTRAFQFIRVDEMPIRVQYSRVDQKNIVSANASSLYFEDLDPDITDEQLCDLCNEFGDVKSIEVCKDNRGRPLGQGYVSYGNPQDATRALDSFAFIRMKGKPIKVQYSHIGANQRQTCSLYVPDLDESVTNMQLYDLFDQLGNPISVRVCRSLKSRKPLCYGYVNYGNPRDAARALNAFQFAVLNGKPIKIEFSHATGEDTDQPPTCILYVGDLDESVTDWQLYQFFAPLGQVIWVRLCKSMQSRRPLGYGYVHYSNPRDAARALNVLQFAVLNGKPIKIEFFHTGGYPDIHNEDFWDFLLIQEELMSVPHRSYF